MVRYTGIAPETTYGTPVTPPTIFLDCKSNTLHPDRETIMIDTSQPTGTPYGTVAGYKIIGDTVIFASAENCLQFFKHIFGEPTTTQDTTSGRYKHVFNCVDDVPTATVYKRVENVGTALTKMQQYISCGITKLKIECSKGNPLQLTASWLGQKDAAVDNIALGTIPTCRQFTAMDAKVYWDVAQSIEMVNVDSISMTLTREINDDTAPFNGAFMQGCLRKAPKLEGEMDLIFDTEVAREAFWGAATGPEARPEVKALSLKFIGDSLGGTAPWDKYAVQFDAPAIILKSLGDPVELRNTVKQSVSFEGYVATIDAISTLLQATVYNKVATA